MVGGYSNKKKGYAFIFLNQAQLEQYEDEDKQYKLYNGTLYPMLPFIPL